MYIYSTDIWPLESRNNVLCLANRAQYLRLEYVYIWMYRCTYVFVHIHRCIRKMRAYIMQYSTEDTTALKRLQITPFRLLLYIYRRTSCVCTAQRPNGSTRYNALPLNEVCHMYEWVTSHILMSHVTHIYESRPGSWLIHLCGMTHSYVCRDSFNGSTLHRENRVLLYIAEVD